MSSTTLCSSVIRSADVAIFMTSSSVKRKRTFARLCHAGRGEAILDAELTRNSIGLDRQAHNLGSETGVGLRKQSETRIH
jgi:hypothetical protein